MMDPLHEQAAREIAIETEGTDDHWQRYLGTAAVAYRRLNLAARQFWEATGIPRQLHRLLDSLARLFN
ncbi:hypothetical protein O4H52_03260 [Sphingomonadaceae bacterium G21617-S1]|nr:hypothetical protein [Sphingomonadaceae bacterium G21617-S1]